MQFWEVLFEQRNNGIWRCNKRRVIRKDEIMEVTPRDDSNRVQKQIKQPVNKKLNFFSFFLWHFQSLPDSGEGNLRAQPLLSFRTGICCLWFHHAFFQVTEIAPQYLDSTQEPFYFRKCSSLWKQRIEKVILIKSSNCCLWHKCRVLFVIIVRRNYPEQDTGNWIKSGHQLHENGEGRISSRKQKS